MNYANIKTFECYLKKVQEIYQVQGLIVGIFDKKDLLYEHTIGYRDVEKKLAIDKDTNFGIASITKSFTIVALLKLVDRGLIDLNEKVSTYYGDWHLAPEHTPTIKQLMSHVGGFYPQERFLMNDMAETMGIDGELAHSKELFMKGSEAIIKRLNQVAFFNGLPGQHFSYSNFSFGILTDLVERYSPDKNYIETVKKEILDPLGLKRTYFEFNRTLREENITLLYTPSDEGVEVTNDYTDLGFVLLGGGGLKSTFNELMTYTRLYLNNGQMNGQEIISSNWIDEMTKERIAYKEHQGYGYGLIVGDLDDVRYAGHSGGLTGVSSFFGFCRESGKGVVVLSNTGGVPATSIGIAALRLAHNQYPDYKVDKYEDSLWSKEMIINTTGLYESEEGDAIEIKACDDGVKAIIGGKELKCRIIRDDLILIKNKLEENYCKILRHKTGKASGIYLGSRIIPRK
jgi:CubicO group peptidase (beta-lactamase class C family)